MIGGNEVCRSKVLKSRRKAEKHSHHPDALSHVADQSATVMPNDQWDDDQDKHNGENWPGQSGMEMEQLALNGNHAR